MDSKKIGEQIVTLRKEKGYTQETLAEALSVSPQAVSKWENGHSLPETSLLSDLARVLDCSIDTILNPSRLRILEALYGDGLEQENVTRRLNRLVEGSRLEIVVNHSSLAAGAAKGRFRYLILKYQNDAGVFCSCTPENKELKLDEKSAVKPLPASKFEIIAASYGNEAAANDVMYRITHHKMFDNKGFNADGVYFPSVPSSDAPEYLTVVYLNSAGIHLATCMEGESLVPDKEQTGFIRQPKMPAESCIIPNVGRLPGFGKGMDCTWAGALTVALNAMGHQTTYERVMGVSGACWRIAFHKTVPGWDYSAVDALVAYDYATPGFKAFGYTPLFSSRLEKANRAAERLNVVSSINEGKPVLGINLRVAFEWGVICGYQDGGSELLCRTYFDKETIDKPDFTNKPGTPERYLPVDNWPFIINRFSEKGAVPTEKENLLNSLKTLVESMNMEDAPRYVMGYKAYRLWQEGLRDDVWYQNADDDNFGRRLDVNYFCFLALCDARRAAAAYLRSAEGLIRGNLAGKLAVIYENISQKVSALLPLLPALEEGYGTAPVKAVKMRRAWTQELRHQQAGLFDEIVALEKQGEGLARKITGLSSR
jgi:transcriptional regulator with XRE-family HTH domain